MCSRLIARLNHCPFRGLATAAMKDFYAECRLGSGAFKFLEEGVWKESTSGSTVKILNPSDNAPVFEVQGEGLGHKCAASGSALLPW